MSTSAHAPREPSGCDGLLVDDFTLVTNQKNDNKKDRPRTYDKLKYSHRTNYLLSNIELPADALLCRNASCTKHSHAIDCFHTNIILTKKC